ncbi:MAG: hypothetical protein ACPG22_00675 [Prochlorococcaceae cyanobacterium]
MAVSQVHLQAPSQSLIGTLCAEAGQLQGQARALQASMAQCGDSVLLGRLQADWLALRHRVKEIKAMAASAAMNQLSDQLSVAFLRELTGRAWQQLSRC